MTLQLDMNELSPRLQELLGRIQSGDEITIADAGKPVAKLVPIVSEAMRPVFGTFKGQVEMADDFCAPLPDDELAEFEK